MKRPQLKINYFFRKPSENFHSIEELFSNIQNNLPSGIDFNNIYLPFHNGIIGRIKNVFFVKKHQTSINHITGDVNYISLGLPRKNTVLTVHDIGSAFVGGKIKRLIISLFWFIIPFRRVKKIITISEFSKQEILKKFKLKEEKIIVIPNCISPKFQYVPKKFNEQKPAILIVGTKKNKNIDLILEALKDINCRLKIIGKLSIEQKQKLQKFEIEYSNYVDINFDKVVKVYQESDLLLFPSFYEGFGMPIIEAQATGIPVITSDIEPMKSVAGKGAVLVSPYKITEIKNAVHFIIENSNLRKNLIEKGLENVSKYSCVEISKNLLNIYQEILNEK